MTSARVSPVSALSVATPSTCARVSYLATVHHNTVVCIIVFSLGRTLIVVLLVFVKFQVAHFLAFWAWGG